MINLKQVNEFLCRIVAEIFTFQRQLAEEIEYKETRNHELIAGLKFNLLEYAKQQAFLPKEVDDRELTKRTKENLSKTAFEKIKKELKRMPQKFRDIFNREWFEKHLRRKTNGLYEIRCTINYVPYSGAGKTVDKAAENFINNIASTRNAKAKTNVAKRILFNDFAEKWFKLIKKPVIKPNTYKNYLNNYTVHIQPYFKNKSIDSITAMQIQPLLLKLERQKIYNVLRNVKLLLTQIFQSALGERLIKYNPMDGVHTLKHEPKKSVALSVVEESKLLVIDNPYKLSYVFLLFAGMRRGELCSARIEEDFIIVDDGKIKAGRNQTTRKIPITPMLAPYLAGITKKEFKAAISVTPDVLTKNFKKICPNHHLHELRHTFITRCQECGVPREVVSVWAGHAADKTMTSTVYTHFTDEFMLKEAKKVDYLSRLYNR